MKKCCELYQADKINIPGIGEVSIRYNFCPNCGERLERYSTVDIVRALESAVKWIEHELFKKKKICPGFPVSTIKHHINQLKGDQ